MDACWLRVVVRGLFGHMAGVLVRLVLLLLLLLLLPLLLLLLALAVPPFAASGALPGMRPLTLYVCVRVVALQLWRRVDT